MGPIFYKKVLQDEFVFLSKNFLVLYGKHLKIVKKQVGLYISRKIPENGHLFLPKGF